MAYEPLIRDSDGSGNVALKKASTTEENYLAYRLGLYLADSDNIANGLVTKSDTTGTAIGSYSNTYYNAILGQHGFGFTDITTETTTLYQKNALLNETDSDCYRPLEHSIDDSQTRIDEFDSADLSGLTNRLISRVFTSDYPGTIKLGTAAPDSDYTLIEEVFYDTRANDDSDVNTYSLYKRTSMLAPDTIRPFRIKRHNDSDGGFYQGLQALTDRQIDHTFGARARHLISPAQSSVGSYQLRTSVQGAPTDAGTWVAKGTATDTRNTAVERDYTRNCQVTRFTDFTGTFLGNYIGVFTRDLAYIGNFLRDFTGNFARDFLSEQDYNTDYVANYTGNFTEEYVGAFTLSYIGDFTRDFVGDFLRDFTGTYTGDFTRDFEGAFAREAQTSFAGNYLGNYTGNFLAQNAYLGDGAVVDNYSFTEAFSRVQVTTFIGNFTGTYTGDFATNFTDNFTRGAEETYTQNFTTTYVDNFTTDSLATDGVYTTDYNVDYLGNYVSNFTGNYVADFIGNFVGDFVGTFTTDISYTSAEQYVDGQYEVIQTLTESTFVYNGVTIGTAGPLDNTLVDGDFTYYKGALQNTLPNSNLVYAIYRIENITIDYIGNRTEDSTANSQGADSTRVQTESFTGNYIGNFVAEFTGDTVEFTDSFIAADYTTDSTSTFTGTFTGFANYTTDSTITSTDDFQQTFIQVLNASAAVIEQYEGTFAGNFVGDFIGNYLGYELTDTINTINTYTLYVRVA